MLKKIGIGFAGLIGLLLVVSLFLPGTTKVSRSIQINSPQTTVFTVLNGYTHMNAWSPWARRDPTATYIYEGPRSGVGAIMHWSGDSESGQGTQEITSIDAPYMIDAHLDFGPQGEAAYAFHLEAPEAGGTEVTWSFRTENGFNPLRRYMGLLISSYVASDYEAGLANMKLFIESLPQTDFTGFEMNNVTATSQAVLFVPISGAPDAISVELGKAYGEIVAFINENDLAFAGMPLSIQRGMSEAEFFMDVAIPVSGLTDATSATGNVQIGQTYAGVALMTTHVGSYHELGSTYDKINAYMAAHGFEGGAPSWEHYVDDPGEVSEAELRTEIYFPLKKSVAKGY